MPHLQLVLERTKNNLTIQLSNIIYKSIKSLNSGSKILLKIYARTYQTVLKYAAYFVYWRTPKLIQGSGSCKSLYRLIKNERHNSVIIITDKGLLNLGMIDNLEKDLINAGIKCCIYSNTVANPSIDNINEALALYNKNNCDGIIAFGGGSPIDCAKGLGARVAKPNKTIAQMKGLLKVRKKIPTLYAIPTTSGTGSEVTITAVITDSLTHEKYAINDMSLIPKYVILDPTLTINLPKHITSTTGLDALTHAVEAYIGRSNTKKTKEFSKKAIKLIFENLRTTYYDGKNIQARENMQIASYYAGWAFRRAYVGYAHAIAHTLGGFYSVPHGLANAVILPYVLEYYGSSIHKKLAELADYAEITSHEDTNAQKAKCFIDLIKKFNTEMNIPNKISGIKNEDISTMIDRAYKEANPLYPVPKILNKKDLENIFKMIKEE